MAERRESLQPVHGAARPLRRRLTWRDELWLALLPTLTILLVLGLVEVLSRQRLLFASLASSAFLIYLDPHHGTNRMRTLVLAHLTAASVGLLTALLLGPGYLAGASAMITTILLMLLLDAVHPPPCRHHSRRPPHLVTGLPRFCAVSNSCAPYGIIRHRPGAVGMPPVRGLHHPSP